MLPLKIQVSLWPYQCHRVNITWAAAVVLAEEQSSSRSAAGVAAGHIGLHQPIQWHTHHENVVPVLLYQRFINCNASAAAEQWLKLTSCCWRWQTTSAVLLVILVLQSLVTQHNMSMTMDTMHDMSLKMTFVLLVTTETNQSDEESAAAGSSLWWCYY